MFYLKLLKQKEGYIGVTSAIIISAMVMAIIVVLSNGNFLSRFNTGFLEIKATAEESAKSCLEYAKLRLASGSYSGDETITFDSYSCIILPIESVSTNKIIKVQATVNMRTSNWRLTVDGYNLNTISLEEVSSF